MTLNITPPHSLDITPRGTPHSPGITSLGCGTQSSDSSFSLGSGRGEHRAPSIYLSANENKGRRPIEIKDKQREQIVQRAFFDLKKILKEKRSIYYSITNHAITAYSFNSTTGKREETRYALNVDSDIEKLLIDNGVTREDAKKSVDQVFDQLAKINQDMLKNTEPETGNSKQHWSRNELGSPQGAQIMVTDVLKVNHVDYRTRAFYEEERGFVKKCGKETQVTPAGRLLIEKMKEVVDLRQEALRLLQKQVKIREDLMARSNARREEIRLEIAQLQKVSEELNAANIGEIERTMMLMDGYSRYPGFSEKKTGRELIQEGPGNLRLLAEKSAEELKKRVVETHTIGWIFRDVHRIKGIEQQAIDGMSGFVYHVADGIDLATLAHQYHNYRQEHFLLTPQARPTAEIFLYQGANYICGMKDAFSSERLWARLPRLLDVNNGQLRSRVDGPTFVQAMQLYAENKKSKGLPC